MAGRPQTRSNIVENCLVLDIAALRPVCIRRAGTVSWGTAFHDEPAAEIAYRLVADGDGYVIHLTYCEADTPIDLTVPLIITRLPFNGLRYWFSCPVGNGARICGRRCRCLYLPPGAQIFGCRDCHDLTYRSCRESHCFG
jgi:hypothetical protein